MPSSFQVHEFEVLRGFSSMATSKGYTTVFGEWPTWKGPKFLVADTSQDHCHELAHLAVAAPSRRHLKWLGLGTPGGIFSGFEGPTIVSADRAMEEEIEASLLGILIQRMLGGDYVLHWKFHEWHTASQFKETLNRLRRKGLVERRGLEQPDGSEKVCWQWTGYFWKESIREEGEVAC